MRASSCAQNWTNSRVGTVGNELRGGHRGLSFGRREAAQTQLLTQLRTKECCLTNAAPFCLNETLPWSPRWMPSRMLSP